MKILIFHPRPLPPKDYGGIERVVLWLSKGLVERGHSVSVAALQGSLLPRGASLIPVHRQETSPLDLIPKIPQGIDLVHFMAPPGEKAWEKLPCPGILTVHGNGKPGEVFPENSVFLSRDHAYRHSAHKFVYNGIDPSEYHFQNRKEDWFLFLSKTSWSVKNLRGAMSACKKASVKLKIAGGARPILSRLKVRFNPLFSWEGPVSGKRKAALLANARALLFPVLWPEPFGLVVVEALISGTPVLASPFGSLPELIPGDVGALIPVTDEEEWIHALNHFQNKWSFERCRQWAMEKFHYLNMAEGYEQLYKKILKGETLHQTVPRTRALEVQ